MRTPLFRVVAFLMAVIFPASLVMADTATATVTPTGQVAVNGAAVLHSTTVFSGDRVVTSENSTASITGRGLSLLVPSNSVLRMADKDVELDCGSALINASNGAGARLSNMRFAPRDESARFEILQQNGGFRIIAHDGVLAVSNGSVPMLQPGEAMFAAAPCAADPSRRNDNAPIPAAGTNFGAAVLLGAAIAGGLAALVYLTTRTKKSTSTP